MANTDHSAHSARKKRPVSRVADYLARMLKADGGAEPGDHSESEGEPKAAARASRQAELGERRAAGELQFSNYNAATIGAGPPNTITSTIDVENITGRISDIDVRLDVDHSFTSDLEIALIGPNGTRVVLVRGEGGEGHGFDATRFDDEAARVITEAIAPFSGSFKPEQELAVFDALDPNGQWTLEITDQAFKDGGQLKSWFLGIEVAEERPDKLEFHSQNPVKVGAGKPNTELSTINVTGHHPRLVTNATVTICIDHSFARDLTLTLISPDNTRITLADRVGGGEDNFDSTTFDDDAATSIKKGEAPFNGSFRPEEPLADLKGKAITGAWRLEVQDHETGDGGALKSWSLAVEAPAEGPTPESQFQIDLEFLGGLTSTQQAVFADAAARWSEAIVGDLPTATVDGTQIDAIVISAQGQDLGGPGGVLGQARPTLLRDHHHNYLPVSGVMIFDIHDLERMESDGSLLDVIIHEMGHVLGVGTLWTLHGLLDGIPDDPVFNGANAMHEYQALMGTANPVPVPVEDMYGPGTRYGHWRESVFDTDLMTGIIEPGGPNPLSRVTLASLADLGYQVDFDAADMYSLPEPGIVAPRSFHKPGHTCGTLHRGLAPQLRADGLVSFVHFESEEVVVGNELEWTMKLRTADGVTKGDTGTLPAQAVLVAPADLPENMADPVDLKLQLDDVTDIQVILITSSIYDGKVEVTGTGTPVPLIGPLLLFGKAISLFADDLTTLKVKNTGANPAKLQILIGRKLTS